MTGIRGLGMGMLTAIAALGAASCSGSTNEVGASAEGVAVQPAFATVVTGGTQPFSATVTGLASTSVTWAVQEGSGGGTVSGTGLYTAPGSTGTFHVVATSVAAPSISGSAQVTVVPPGSLNGYDVPPWIAGLPATSNGLPWNPGVPGGIPAGTVDTTLTTAQMTASAINSALAAASSRGGPTNIRVVVMPAGTFALSGTIVPRNYAVLRGAGPWGAGRTRLNFSGGGFASPDTDWSAVPKTTMALAAGATLPIGSTTVPVASATGIGVGDLIQLDQLDDLSYVAILDAGYHKRAPFTDGPYHGPISPGGFRSVASVHVVTAVNGTNVTFDPPTRMEYRYYSAADGTTRLNPEVWRVSRRGTDGVWYSGLEDFSMAGAQNGGIVLWAGAYNWVRNVETDGSANGGISNDHVSFNHQFRSEIRRVYAHHTTGGPYSGGANYGINLNAATSECLVIDSIVMRMNKLIQSNACGPGNVIAYNYVDDTSANGGNWMDGAINGSHQSFSHMLLVEGNWSANIGCDTTHGVSGYMAFLRNYSQGYSTHYSNGNNLRAANSDGWQREMAFEGNVLNTNAGGSYQQTGQVSGSYTVWSIGQNVWGAGDDFDTNTAGGTQNTVVSGVPYPPRNAMSYSGTTWDARQATFATNAMSKLWRHGNWDPVTNGVNWDPSYSAHAIPPSLFLLGAPSFFGAHAWPWVEPTAGTAGGRVQVLPAKARFDAGTPFTDQ